MFTAAKKDGIILWEAHRGGGGGFEMPESCKLSFEYGWLLGGRPEADVNMTVDGVMVSLHDSTVDRIARNAPADVLGKPVGELTFEQVRSCEVGSDEFPGQKIPAMEELFACLKIHPERAMVIDYKRVELQLLADMIKQYGVGSQITFAFCNRELCRQMKALVPEIRTKNWLGGSAESIMNQFQVLKEEDFRDITEVQLHLNDVKDYDGKGWRWQLPQEVVAEALAVTQERGVLLQAAPWRFERENLLTLLDMGVRSFAVDFPNKFVKVCAEYFGGCW